MIGTLLAYAAAAGFIAIGLGALLAPATSSQQYGLATKDATALSYVRALGVRDLVIGLLLLAFSLSREQAPRRSSRSSARSPAFRIS